LKIESRKLIQIKYNEPVVLVDVIAQSFLTLDNLVLQMIELVKAPHHSKFAQYNFNGTLIRVSQNSDPDLIVRDYFRKDFGAFIEVVGPDCEQILSSTDQEIDRLLTIVAELQSKSVLEKNPQT
jgi:hypothetical protein